MTVIKTAFSRDYRFLLHRGSWLTAVQFFMDFFNYLLWMIGHNHGLHPFCLVKTASVTRLETKMVIIE